MFFCDICNKNADIHHIVHKSEGGFDIEVNFKYLCTKHHRGTHGPHKCLQTDILYKIEMQNKLYNLFFKKYYTFKELTITLNTSTNMIKRITKNLKIHKEGYNRDELILTLMGGKLYSIETLQNIELQKLIDNIY